MHHLVNTITSHRDRTRRIDKGGTKNQHHPTVIWYLSIPTLPNRTFTLAVVDLGSYLRLRNFSNRTLT